MNIIYPIVIVIIAYCVLGDGKMLKNLKSGHIVLITLAIWLFTVTMNKHGYVDVPSELGTVQAFREEDGKKLWWRNPEAKILIEQAGEEVEQFKGFGWMDYSGLVVGGLFILGIVGSGVWGIWRIWINKVIITDLETQLEDAAQVAVDGGGQRGGGKKTNIAIFIVLVVLVFWGIWWIFSWHIRISTDPIEVRDPAQNEKCDEFFATEQCMKTDGSGLCGRCVNPVTGENAEADTEKECTQSSGNTWLSECPADCFLHKGCLAATDHMSPTALSTFQRNNPEYVDVTSLASQENLCVDKYPLSVGDDEGSSLCNVNTDKETCHKVQIGKCSPNYGDAGTAGLGFQKDDITTPGKIKIHDEIRPVCETMHHNKSECEMYADRCIPNDPKQTSGWYGGDSEVPCKDQWNKPHICEGILTSANGDPRSADHHVCHYLDKDDPVDNARLIQLCTYTDVQAITGQDAPPAAEQRCKWNESGALFEGDDQPLDTTNIEDWKYAYYLPLPTLSDSEVTGLLTQLGVNEDSASGWAASTQADNDIDKKKHLFSYIMDFATHKRDTDVGQCQTAGKYKCPQAREDCVEGICPAGHGPANADGLCLNGMRAQRCGQDDMDSDDPQGGYCVEDCSQCLNYPHKPSGSMDPTGGHTQWNPTPSTCVSTLNSSSGITPPRLFACSGNTFDFHDVQCPEGKTVKGPSVSWKPEDVARLPLETNPLNPDLRQIDGHPHLDTETIEAACCE